MLPSALGSPTFLLSVGSKEYVKFFGKNYPSYPKGSPEVNLALVLVLGFILHTTIGADRAALWQQLQLYQKSKWEVGFWERE